MKKADKQGAKKTITRIIWWLTAWLVLLPNHQVFACSPPMSYFRCEADSNLPASGKVCLANDCSISIIEDEWGRHIEEGGYSIGYFNNQVASFYASKKPDPDQLDAICAIDLANSPGIHRLYQNWNEPLGSIFEIERNSESAEEKLKRIQTDYLSCVDIEYITAGNFLASYDTLRGYCAPSTPIIPCGNIAISPILFAGFLFTHPDLSTLPYIAVLLIILSISGFGLIMLHRRGHLGLFFRPSKLHMWGLAIGFPILFCLSVVMLPYFSYQVVAFYLILSTVNYSKESRRMI